MSKLEIIYACPHGCKARLICKCEVTQTWYIDVKGNPVEVESSDGPDFFYETPRCSKCHAMAEEHRCKVIPVSGVSGPVGLAYIPVDNGNTALLLRTGENAPDYAEPLSITQKNNEDTITIDGIVYILGNDGFFPRMELPGQENLFLKLSHLCKKEELK